MRRSLWARNKRASGPSKGPSLSQLFGYGRVMKPPTLSKSSFSSGLQCHKRLWIEKRQPELVPETPPSQQAIFDQGHEVGYWSHKLFPDGILVTGELDFQAHLQASREALGARKPLFEPAFAVPGAYARADILVPVESGGWNQEAILDCVDEGFFLRLVRLVN